MLFDENTLISTVWRRYLWTLFGMVCRIVLSWATTVQNFTIISSLNLNSLGFPESGMAEGGIPLTSCNSPFWMAIPISLKTVKANLSVFGVMIYGKWNVQWKIACAWIRTPNSITNRANVNHYATTTCLRQKSNLSWWSITTTLRHLGQ